MLTNQAMMIITNHCLLFILLILAGMIPILFVTTGCYSISSIVRVNCQTCRGMSQYDQCSTNNDCGCLPLTISDDSGVCGFLWINCSRLEPCEIQDDYCENPGHVCVHHPRCHNVPVCYPLSMIDQRICPPSKKITTNNITTNNTTTMTFRTTTVSLSSRPKDGICTTATWARHGITVIGGNNHGSPLINFQDPQGMFVDENQTIYIADTVNRRVVIWEQDAPNVKIITDGNDSENTNIPYDVVVDKNGTIYIVYSNINKVQKWVRGADKGETMANIHAPISIAIDNEESIYVGSLSSSKVKKWRKGATNGQVLISGEVGHCTLTVDRNRSIYIADMYHHRVLKIDEGKRNISVVAGGSEDNDIHQLLWPHSITVDDSGALYVTDTRNHRVTRWLPGSTNGTVIIGDRGPGFRSDQLNRPTDLEFDSEGNLYVVDSNNGRIQKFLIDNSSCQ